MHWQNKIKLLCWDLDGTLYPSNPVLKQHITDLIIKTIAEKNNWSETRASSELKEKISVLKSTTKSLTQLGVNGQDFFVNTWNTIDLNLYIKKNTKLSSAIKNSKLACSIFTNSNTLDNVDTKLAAIGVNPNDFSFIMTSTVLGFNKPDLKVFEAIIERSGLKAEEILYIGDRDIVDVIPAKKAGLKTCMVNGKSEYADLSMSSPAEVIELFNRLSDDDM